jgi:hypothetical protein
MLWEVHTHSSTPSSCCCCCCRSLLLLCVTDIGLRHTSLLGVVCASAAALQGPRPLAWGACAALERQLLLALPQDAGGADMLLPLLLDAIEAVAAGKVGGFGGRDM